MKTTIMECDVKEQVHSGEVKSFDMQVVFVTEQNEGRATTPYFSNVKIDLCANCLKRLIESRKVLTAVGAMGYNDYFMK